MEREELLKEIYSHVIKVIKADITPTPYETWKVLLATRTDDELRKMLVELRKLTK